jgi:hypothetical protein
MSRPRITYATRQDVTIEGELNALAAVYRIILDSRANRHAAGVASTESDDAMKGSEHDGATPNNA